MFDVIKAALDSGWIVMGYFLAVMIFYCIGLYYFGE